MTNEITEDYRDTNVGEGFVESAQERRERKEAERIQQRITKLERQNAELCDEIERLQQDRERLDTLESLCESYGCSGVHEGNRWVIDGPFANVRVALDEIKAARKEPK